MPLCLLLLLAAPSARADNLVDPRGFIRGVLPSEIFYLNILASTAAGASAMTTLVENGLISRMGTRPPLIWRVLGYVMGGSCVGLGALNAALSQGDSNMLAAGVGLIGLGLLDIGLASWGGRQAEATRAPSPPRLIFGPRVLTDAAGRPAYGVGVSLANW